MLKRHSCNWVSYSWIDADDAFLDGYFQYITDIPKKLATTKTVSGAPWRGAIFIARECPRLTIGNNKCAFGDYKSYNPEVPFYSGRAPGRGIILRRHIWTQLDLAEIKTWLHIYFVRDIRNSVMHGLGYTDYSSEACSKGYFHWKNTTEQIDLEKRDAAETRLLLIDVTVDWKTSGILVTSPFSAHYPWAFDNALPICNKEERLGIQKMFPKDMMYILHAGNMLKLSIEQCCRNNFRLAWGMRKSLENMGMCDEVLEKFHVKLKQLKGGQGKA